MNNNTRANNGLEAFQLYESRHNLGNEGATSILIDLLTDLRHFAEENELGFDDANFLSEINFNEETQC